MQAPLLRIRNLLDNTHKRPDCRLKDPDLLLTESDLALLLRCMRGLEGVSSIDPQSAAYAASCPISESLNSERLLGEGLCG